MHVLSVSCLCFFSSSNWSSSSSCRSRSFSKHSSSAALAGLSWKKQSSLKLGKKRDGCDWIVLYKSLIYDLRIKCLVYSKRWTAWMLYEIQLKFLNLHPLHWHFSQIKEKISSIHNKIPHFYNPYSSIILFKMITNKKKVHGLPLSK